MALEINTAQAPTPYEHVTIMRLRGRIIASESEPIDLGHALRSVNLGETLKSQKPGTLLLLDMTQVSWIDNPGIGELMGGVIQITNQGGQVKLLACQKAVKNRLQITNVWDYLTVNNYLTAHDDEAIAIKSFSPPRAQSPAELHRTP